MREVSKLSDREIVYKYEKYLECFKPVPKKLLEIMYQRGIGTNFTSMYFLNFKKI